MSRPDLAAMLATVGTDTRYLDPTTAWLTLGPGIYATARLRDGWFSLATPGASLPTAPVDLLAASSALPAEIKVVWRAGGTSELCVELPMGPGLATAAHTAAAAERLVGAAGGTTESPAPAHADRPITPALAEVASTIDWPCSQRNADAFAIELAVDPSFQQAILTYDPDRGAIELRAALLTTEVALAPACHAAVALLLLRTAASVRLVRAFGETHQQGFTAGFTVTFVASPTATELHHACAALSVACRFAMHEVHALAADARAADVFSSFAHPGTNHQPEGEVTNDYSHDCPARE